MTAPADTDASIAGGLDPVAEAASFEDARAQALEDLTDVVGRVRACSATEVPRLIVTGVPPIGRPTPSTLRMPRTST